MRFTNNEIDTDISEVLKKIQINYVRNYVRGETISPIPPPKNMFAEQNISPTRPRLLQPNVREHSLDGHPQGSHPNYVRKQNVSPALSLRELCSPSKTFPRLLPLQAENVRCLLWSHFFL